MGDWWGGALHGVNETNAQPESIPMSILDPSTATILHRGRFLITACIIPFAREGTELSAAVHSPLTPEIRCYRCDPLSHRLNALNKSCAIGRIFR